MGFLKNVFVLGFMQLLLCVFVVFFIYFKEVSFYASFSGKFYWPVEVELLQSSLQSYVPL